MKTKELIEEISDLPVEDRALVADSVLRTLNPTDPEMDNVWAKEARRRLKEFREGRVKPIPGEEVIDSIRMRFSK